MLNLPVIDLVAACLLHTDKHGVSVWASLDKSLNHSSPSPFFAIAATPFGAALVTVSCLPGRQMVVGPVVVHPEVMSPYLPHDLGRACRDKLVRDAWVVRSSLVGVAGKFDGVRSEVASVDKLPIFWSREAWEEDYPVDDEAVASAVYLSGLFAQMGIGGPPPAGPSVPAN